MRHFRRWIALAGVVCLLTACADKSQPVEGPNGLPAPLEAEPDVPQETPAPPPGGSPASPTTPPSGDAPSRPDAPPTSSGRGQSAGDDGIAAAARGGVGSFAATLLQPSRSQRIVLDVISEPDAGPASASLDHAVRVVREASAKPVSVTTSAATAGRSSWTAQDLRGFADENAPTAQGDGTAALRLLFVHGGLEGNDAAVGVAVRGDVVAIFSDRVDESASPFVSRARMEDAVLIHEIGHLLGLVDLVIDTGRDDPEHPGHSRNSDSVMYWAVESTLVGQALSGPPPTEFDSADRADLARIRSGG